MTTDCRTWDKRLFAERGEDEVAGITGPPCPFCGSQETTGVTEGWPHKGDSGEWACGHCGESGPFDADGLHWAPEGDPTAVLPEAD